MHVVASWDGRHAHALRLALRLTCEEFARTLGVAVRSVADWEANPMHIPRLATQQLLDVALERASAATQERFRLILADEAGEKPIEDSSEDQRRRSRKPPTVMRTLTPHMLSYLRRALHAQYLADNLLGPRPLLPEVTVQLDIIDQLRGDASRNDLDDLLRIGAAYAEFASWLCHDSGDVNAAVRWCTQALEMAQIAADRRLVAFILTRRAAQQLALGEPHYAIRLTEAAQVDTGPDTSRVRALAAQTAALGHATIGAVNDVSRSLDKAEGLIERAQVGRYDGDPSEGRYCEPHLYLRITRAKCSLTLGDVGKAIAGFLSILDALPPDYHRDRGQYLAYLAQAYLLAAEPEPACATIEESLDIALATGSTRTVGELRRRVVQRLDAWGKLPCVIHTKEILAGINPVSGR